MKKISLIFIFPLLFARVNGQDYTDPRALGDKAFNNKNYYEAAFYYKKAAEGLKIVKQIEIPYHASERDNKKLKPADLVYISYRLAESYRLYENYIEASGWYEKVLNQNSEDKYPLALRWYGVCLRATQHLDESIKQLQQFSSTYKGDNQYLDMAKKEIATCRFANEQYRYPLFVDIIKMKDAWNSDGSDYAIIKRDKNYWFTSSRLIKEDKKHLNRIYAAREDNMFKPEMIEFKMDEKKPELEYGTPSIDPTGKRMYLTRWYKKGAAIIHAIYKSEWKNNEWNTPVKLNVNVNADGFNSIQPFISADGKRLFFASNKPGGQGGDDIWRSDLDNDGNPVNSVNLGKTINTPFDEQAPYYDETNRRLIYSSKGFLVLGGFDFFESMETGNQWSVARNMGYPINSAKDDLYYYPDNTDANKFYISSDRASECCLDLFEVHDQRYMFTGLVVDCDTHTPLTGAKISFVDSLSKQTIKTYTLTKTGKYVFSVNNRRPYNMVIEKNGYFTKTIPMPLQGKMSRDTLNNPEICLQALKVNKPIVLKNILYDFGKPSLRPESEIVLNELVTLLKDNPKIRIELSSHTDSIGSDAFNQNLSQLRAQLCVDYIVSRGISKDRLIAKGYGKSRPIAPNSLPNGQDNPEGRQLNRRTEFTVLKTE